MTAKPTQSAAAGLNFRGDGLVGATARMAIIVIATMILAPTLPAAPPFLDTCAECHGARGMGGHDPMVPVIAGIPAGHVEEAIFAYVDGARNCVRVPRMCSTVSVLSDVEIAEIAEYFAGQVREPSNETFDASLAAEGARLHEAHCERCHWPPDRDGVEFAVGIPLHGQKSAYIRFALEAYASGDREALVPAMADAIQALKPGDLGALVNYYSSYRPTE
jgi:sulfide dehydrogenase cytochrome subunit